jgi:hypothetical protein
MLHVLFHYVSKSNKLCLFVYGNEVFGTGGGLGDAAEGGGPLVWTQKPMQCPNHSTL